MVDRDESQMHEEHKKVLRLADEALLEAANSIASARKKLAVAQRNYEERMRVPHSKNF